MGTPCTFDGRVAKHDAGAERFTCRCCGSQYDTKRDQPQWPRPRAAATLRGVLEIRLDGGDHVRRVRRARVGEAGGSFIPPRSRLVGAEVNESQDSSPRGGLLGLISAVVPRRDGRPGRGLGRGHQHLADVDVPAVVAIEAERRRLLSFERGVLEAKSTGSPRPAATAWASTRRRSLGPRLYRVFDLARDRRLSTVGGALSQQRRLEPVQHRA